MVGFLIAVLSGALMSVQGVFNTQVTKASSIWAANVFVQFSAFLVCLVAQIAAAYVIELFGLFGAERQPWEWRRAIGLAVAVAGIAIFKWE